MILHQLEANLQLFTISFYNLQGFQTKNPSTNLQECLEINVDSTMNVGSNLQSMVDWLSIGLH